MLHLTFAAGLGVSELVGLRLDQLERETASAVHVMGKGRRERVLPLWKETTAVLKAWLAVRPASRDAEFFLNAKGRAMTRAGFEYILDKHAAAAARKQPSIAGKRVTPPVLRHTCAMHTLWRRATFARYRSGSAMPACKAPDLSPGRSDRKRGSRRDGAASAQTGALSGDGCAPRDAEDACSAKNYVGETHRKRGSTATAAAHFA